MSEILDAKANIAKYKRLLLSYSSYPNLHAAEIVVCKKELAALKSSLAEMQANLCLACNAAGKLPAYYFFSKRCEKCCGDGHMLHIRASEANADGCEQDC